MTASNKTSHTLRTGLIFSAGGNDGNRVLEAVKTVIVKMNFNDEDKNCRVGSCG